MWLSPQSAIGRLIDVEATVGASAGEISLKTTAPGGLSHLRRRSIITE
jgi:hypothetical protein